MKYYEAAWRLRKMKLTGSSANILLVTLIFLMTAGAGAQVSEVAAASKVADALSTKDFIWLVLFVAAAAIIAVIVLVRALIQEAQDARIQAVQTATAIQRLCDIIEDKSVAQAKIDSDARRRVK